MWGHSIYNTGFHEAVKIVFLILTLVKLIFLRHHSLNKIVISWSVCILMQNITLNPSFIQQASKFCSLINRLKLEALV
jgi:hypothetical protein